MEPFFWQLHFLSALSPTLLRIVVGLYFLYMARFLFKEGSALLAIRNVPIIGNMQPWMIQTSVTVTAFMGLMLIVGFQTSLASLFGILIATKHLYGIRAYGPYLPFSRSTYILLLVLCISLLITGPGIFAVDSPLY